MNATKRSNPAWTDVTGRVKRGHGVASGTSPDSPYPGGSIAAQALPFLKRGLDISLYFPGTINVDISPRSYRMISPSITFRKVRWTSLHPPEDFSFSECLLETAQTKVAGLLYFPHPQTKVRHFQSDTLLEVLAPLIHGLSYETEVILTVNPAEVEII